jgi:aspartokinase/homoserine dehydrogenase 1
LIELNKDCIVKFGSTFNSDNITKDTEVIFSGDCKPNLPAVVSIENNKLSEIRIIHESLSNWFGFASQIFKITSKVGVNLIGYNYSIENDYISIFVNEGDKLKLCSELLNNLVINREKMMKVNLLILGYGNVGKELVNRLLNVKFSDCEINLKGIIRSKTEVIVDESNKYNTNGFNFIFRDNYENDIQDLSRFGLNSNSSQVIIIDVTSSFDVSSNYLNWMSLGWHVITANKIANSGDFTYYSKLHENKLLDETSFLYEANVGAGLPIIRTIRDIYLTGDTIIKFRAVLSGTLSFIFNQMSIGKTFKTSVLDAFSLGYTEPDPRDDLSGLDFARKVVIILREMGLKISLDQIKLTELLPQNLIDCSKDDFFSNISSLDDFFNLSFSDLINKKIQLIAEFENDLISVKLVKLESNDIFTTLKNGENLIEIYTKNYNNMPLIIRGPGAGKEVTVSGILSDLLKVISK